MLQFVNIKDSTVTFANEEKDPQKQTDQMADFIGALLLESAQDKATIQETQDMVGSLLLEVAILKGGM